MGHTEASGIRVWGLALHGIQGFRVQGLGYWVRGSEKRGSLYPKLCLGVGSRFFFACFRLGFGAWFGLWASGNWAASVFASERCVSRLSQGVRRDANSSRMLDFSSFGVV